MNVDLILRFDLDFIFYQVVILDELLNGNDFI